MTIIILEVEFVLLILNHVIRVLNTPADLSVQAVTSFMYHYILWPSTPDKQQLQLNDIREDGHMSKSHNRSSTMAIIEGATPKVNFVGFLG
jgi:hypothetical protein